MIVYKSKTIIRGLKMHTRGWLAGFVAVYLCFMFAVLVAGLVGTLVGGWFPQAGEWAAGVGGVLALLGAALVSRKPAAP
jgi:uncharacterized membrane protein